MTKENFIRIINELEYGENLQQKIANAVRQYNNLVNIDYPEPFGMVITHDFLVMDLLAEIMCDTTGVIDYFCVELEYGKKYHSGCITEADGTEIDLSNSDKLWEYLVKNRNK